MTLEDSFLEAMSFQFWVEHTLGIDGRFALLLGSLEGTHSEGVISFGLGEVRSSKRIVSWSS